MLEPLLNLPCGINNNRPLMIIDATERLVRDTDLLNEP